MEYVHYADVNLATENTAAALHYLSRVEKDKNADKEALENAKRHLMEAGLWLAKLRGDI